VNLKALSNVKSTDLLKLMSSNPLEKLLLKPDFAGLLNPPTPKAMSCL
jgi:hypothetical protein